MVRSRSAALPRFCSIALHNGDLDAIGAAGAPFSLAS